MDRIDWKKTFIDIAEIISKHSTCARIKVGAVIVNQGRIVSIGYNGTPSGQEHCCDHFKNRDYSTDDEFKKEHGIFSNNMELHAEQNAIAFAAKDGIKIENCILYTTLSPCIGCAKLIVSAGIKEVYYKKEYDRDKSGIEFLINNKVTCKEYTSE